MIKLSRYYTVPVAGPASALAQVDPVDSDCHRSWICFPQSSELARAARFPAHSAKSMQITQPCLFYLQTHYNYVVLYGRVNLAGLLCILPMLCYLMGIEGDRGTGFVVKVYTDYIGLNAVTPVLYAIVYQWEIPKGNLIKYLYLFGYIHEELNFLKQNKELWAVFRPMIEDDF